MPPRCTSSRRPSRQLGAGSRADAEVASGSFDSAQTSRADPPSMLHRLKWSTGLCMISKISAILALAALASCGSLPTIVPDMARRSVRPVQLEGARGPLSAQQSKAILDRLTEPRRGDQHLRPPSGAGGGHRRQPAGGGQQGGAAAGRPGDLSGHVRRHPRRQGPYQPGNLHHRGRRGRAAVRRRARSRSRRRACR